MKIILNKIIALVTATVMCFCTISAVAAYGGAPFGDMDKSGSLSAIDKVILLRMMLGFCEETPEGDVDSDGFVGVSDIFALEGFILGAHSEIRFCFPSRVNLPERLSFDVGYSIQLKPIVYPENCIDASLIWKTSDKSVATVEHGLITAVSEGVANITAYSQSGASAVCVITVTRPAPVLMPATITGVYTYLRVRSVPSTDGEILGSFAPNQKITVIGEIENGWYHVTGKDRQSGETVEGYSSGEYITLDDATVVTEETTETTEITDITETDDISDTTPPEPPEIVGGFASKIAALRIKFPEGKYWNHAVGGDNAPDYYTSTPCDHHEGECDYSGECGCNSFSNAIQCMGFAFKIGYDLYDTSPRVWKSVEADTIAAGDYLRYNGHSMIVLTVTEEGITVVEANYDNKCGIFWDRFISMQKLNANELDLRRHG